MGMSTLQGESEPTLAVTKRMASGAASALSVGEGRRACVGQAKIMIVDDEPINIKALEKHLRSAGYENLIHTTDPREALKLIADEQPA